ncbi:MAG: type II secretion system F family protein [Planctomycetota bacterium]
MATFTYTARDLTGSLKSGTLEASSDREAGAILAEQSLFPTKIEEAKEKLTLKSALARGKRVNGQTMAIFYSQMASLLRAGVPMIRSLTVLSEQSPNPTLAATMTEIRGKVEDGESLGDAMSRHPRIFSDMACNMVRAGTEGGFLEDALERVGKFTELQEDLKGRTVSALAYPVFLFCVGTVVVIALLVFFVPGFDPLFDRLRRNDQMPGMTEALLSVSNFTQSYGLVLLGVLVIGGGFLIAQLKTPRGQIIFDRIKLKIPVLGGILMNLAVARFCRVLGTLLANGVPIVRSLEISSTAAGNRLLQGSIASASENLQSGEQLATPLRRSGYFPISVVEMISVGEESNSLDTVLPDIADSLEKTTFRRLDLFVRLLEPLMLLVMAVLVLAVVMALLVPVLKSSSSV